LVAVNEAPSVAKYVAMYHVANKCPNAVLKQKIDGASVWVGEVAGLHRELTQPTVLTLS